MRRGGWLSEALVILGGLLVAVGLGLVYLPAGVVAVGLVAVAYGVGREVR